MEVVTEERVTSTTHTNSPLQFINVERNRTNGAYMGPGHNVGRGWTGAKTQQTALAIPQAPIKLGKENCYVLLKLMVLVKSDDAKVVLIRDGRYRLRFSS